MSLDEQLSTVQAETVKSLGEMVDVISAEVDTDDYPAAILTCELLSQTALQLSKSLKATAVHDLHKHFFDREEYKVLFEEIMGGEDDTNDDFGQFL